MFPLSIFERFTEEASMSLFFARQVMAEHGGTSIDPEHLLLGVLQASPAAVGRFASIDDAVRVMTEALVRGLHRGPSVPDSQEIPFSDESLRAIEQAIAGADDMKHERIRPEHLVLGVLAQTSGAARDVLVQQGVRAPAIREFLKGT